MSNRKPTAQSVKNDLEKAMIANKADHDRLEVKIDTLDEKLDSMLKWWSYLIKCLIGAIFTITCFVIGRLTLTLFI